MNPNPTYEDLKKRIAELEQQVEQYQTNELQYPPEIHSVLMEAFRYIPLCKTFEDAAKEIFEQCKRLTGARSGYVALLSENGEENEVLFLDAGGLPCDVDPNLPMPIRGLREIAYKTKEVAYDNSFHESLWMKHMPEGHVRLDNVLFAPLNIEYKTVGVIGIANKPGGFSKYDVNISKILADLAVVALTYAKSHIQLKNSEELFRTTFEQVAVGIAQVKPDGVFKIVNSKFADIVGYSKYELTMMSFDEITYPEDLNKESKAIELVIKGETDSFEIEKRYIHKSGHLIWIKLYSNVVKDEKDNIKFAVASVIDITERKMAETALRQSEEKYRKLYDDAPVGYFEYDRQGNITRVNHTELKMLGYTAEEMIGRPCWEFIVDEAVREQILAKLDGARPPAVGLERTYQRKDGTTFPVLFEDRLLTDEDGHVTGIRTAIQDITEHKRAQEELESHYALLRIAGLTAKFGGWSVDLGNNIVTWSDEVAEIHEMPRGYTPEVSEAIQFYAPEWQDRITHVFRNCAEKGVPYDEEMEIITATNKRIWVRTNGEAVPDVDGKIVKVLGAFQDITERKRAETYREMGQEILQILNEPGDLQEAIQRVLTALKTRTGVDAAGLRLQEGDDFPYFAQDGFSKDFLLTENTLLERDKDGGVCRDKDGNARLECTCGLVISGKTDPSNPLFTQGGSCWTNDSFSLLDLPSEQDLRMHPRNNCIHQGYASVALIPVRIQDQMYSRETCARHGFRSLAQVPVRTRDRIVGLIQLNDQRKGRFTLETIELLEGIAAHVGSTLLRKRVEDALRESEQFRDRVIQSLASGLYVYNLEKSYNDFISDQYTVLTGWTLDEINEMGQRFIELFHPEDRPRVEEHFRNIQKAEDGEVLEIEYRFRTKDGRWIWCISRDTVFERNEHGDITRFIGSYFDITERVKLQTQLNQAQKMESVGRLAGGVAHDFNNMLSVILGNTELVLEDLDSTQPLHDNLQEIQKAAQRSTDVVRQLLAFARKQTISPKVLDLNDTVEDMLKMLRRLIGEDIDLSWQPGHDIWPIKVDPAQIDQVLANLSVNARDAIDGVGKLTIETGKVSFDEAYCSEHQGFVPGEFVLLAVSDNGCGMDAETQKNLFEPFFTTKEVGQGTGLGLATVFGIVKQNNGFINVYSEPNQGTTFKIYLPRHRTVDTPVRVEGLETSDIFGSETILLVEDETTILKMTRMMLERLGYTVLTAATPGEAMDVAREHGEEINLLMTDVVMPEMNGRDLAGKLLSLYPDLKWLFMSGYTANVIAHHGILDEGVSFIQKPFSKQELSVKVRKVLDEKD